MGWSHQGPYRVGVGLLLFCAVFLTDARECKINCHGAPGNTLQFEAGKVYNYKLEGKSATVVTGATGESSELSINADVQVAVLSGCEHALKVTNVQVAGQDKQKRALNKLSQFPIKFGLQNGHIGSELCANDAEDSVGLNIKRAVLSMLQSAALKDSGYATQTETDIFGSCPTGFEFSKSGNTLTVLKTRDLNKCARREDITLPYLSTPYYVQSDIQSSPMLHGSLRSEQKIAGGILKSATLEEQYNYRPVSAPEAVVKVNVNTRLNFVNSAPGAIPAACTVPRTIIFEQEHHQEGVGVSNKIVELIKQGCENRIIGRDTASKFSQLVRSVAGASKTDIQNAMQHVKSGPGIKDRSTAQRMLMDAIVMAQSGSSVEIMADILKKKEVTGNQARMWLLGLGAVKHATRSALVAVLPLLDGEPPVEAFLGIGSLAGKFCRQHTCENVNEVNQLQIKLGAPLLKGCSAGSKKEEDHIIASLKGLGNIKFLGPKIAGKIVECAQNKNAPPRVRVAALETIATDPNKEQFKTLALNLLQNIDEDSEIRIKAYQILLKCPCGKVAGAIKDLLKTEKSNQVGGYIVSSLRNLHASTNPDKEAARHHLGSIIPPRRFPIDPRRYSMNQELSYSNGFINSGASAEGDIIYSQNSFLPRSMSLNLTTQIFGTAYNFLQLDMRAENLERLAEGLFGPQGYFTYDFDVEEFLDEGKQEFSNVLERIASRYDQVLRPKRSVSQDQLDKVANKVHLPSSSDDLELDLSLKILGSEVAWTPHHGRNLKVDEGKVIDGYFGILEDMVHNMKNSEVDYRRHFTFTDREITYPTGMGLALRLRALGTAALRLKLDGKIDIPAILKDPKNTDIRFQIIPSAAINLGGEFSIDGVVLETGVRMDVNIHSSTGSDLTLRVLDGHGVDVKIGLPIPKQELISVKTEYNSVSREDNFAASVAPVKFDTPRESYSGCFDQLNMISGLTFCGEIDIPWEQGRPMSLTYGPMNMGVTVVKDDSLTSYHFKAYYVKNEDKVHAFELLLDTPNSKPNRKLSLNFEGSLEAPKKYVNVELTSPWTDASFRADVVDTPQENSFNLKFVNMDQEYTARVGAKIVESSKGKTKYEPIFEYKAPEGTKSALIGKKGGPKPKQSITTSGAVIVEETPNGVRYIFQELGLSLRSKYTLDGQVLIEVASIDGDLKFTYDKEHVKIKGKGRMSDDELSGRLEIAPTEYRDLGVSASLDAAAKIGKRELKLILVHGPDPKSEVSRIFIHHNLEWDTKKTVPLIPLLKQQIHPYTEVYEATYPVVGLDVSVKSAVADSQVSGGFKGKLDKYSAKLEGALKHGGKAISDYQASVDAEFMGQELKFQSSKSAELPDNSRLTNLLILKPGGTYQLNALVHHQLTNQDDFDFSIEADGSIPDKSIIKLSGAAKCKNNKCDDKLKFYIGDKCYVDGQSTITFGKAPNGNFKLSLPGYLETEGKLSSDGSQSSFSSQLYLPKADRKMEAKGELTVKAPKYSGVLSVCYDTKDPKKTFKIQSDNEFSWKGQEGKEGSYSLDTKNKVSHADTVIEVNGKSSARANAASAASNTEVEVVLPNGYKAGGKYNDKLSLQNTYEGEANLELWDQPRGSEQQKLEVKIVGKRVDPRSQTFDGQGSLSYTSRDKKNINAYVNAKKVPASSGKASNIAVELGSSGSLIDLPVSFKLESEVSNEYFDLDESLSIEDDLPPLSFKVSGSAGSDIQIDGVGKIGKPSTLEISGKLPETAGIKNFKLSTSALVDLGGDSSKENDKVKLSNSLKWNDNKLIKVLVEGQREDNGLQFVVEYETDQIPKRRISGSGHLVADESIKGDASVSVNANNEVSEFSIKGDVNKERTDNSIHIIANSKRLGDKVDLVLKNKVVKEGKGYQSDLIVTRGGKKMTATAKVELDRDHPLLELNVDSPDRKGRLFFKSDKKGDRHYVTELDAKWSPPEGGLVYMKQEVNLESPENFVIRGAMNLPTMLEDSKLEYEVTSRPAKGDNKKITFFVKGGDKNIVSGNSNYNFKEEGDLAVLEGSGSLVYKDETYPLKFQASRQNLENGFLRKMSFNSGKMSLNVQNKVTPEEYLWERTICGGKENKCSKAQISSKIKTGLESEEQSVIVKLDLSLLNHFVKEARFHDISYKSQYKRENLIADHNIEFQWADDAKLKSHAFVHENAAGLYVDFPKRTVGGEVKYDTARKDNSASLRVEAELYLNKGKDPKLSFIAGTTTVYDKGAATIAGEAKITHPKLQKDLVAKGQLSMSDKPAKLVEGLMEIDVSPDANNKLIGKLKVSGTKENLVTVASLKSKGCNIDIAYEEKIKMIFDGKESQYFHMETLSYVDSKGTKREFVAKFEASPKRIFGLLKAPEALIEADFRTDKGYSGNLNIFGKKYHDSLSYNKETQIATYQLTGLAGGKNLVVEAGGKIGGKGVFLAKIGDQKACSLDVALDETNFLKSKYSYDTEVFKNIYAAFTNEINLLVKDGSKNLNNVYERNVAEGKRLLDCLQNARPDLRNFVNHVQGQLKQMREEIANDKSFKEAAELLKHATGNVGEQFAAIAEELVKLAKTLGQLFDDSLETLVSIFKEFQPKLKASLQRFSKLGSDLLEQYLKLSNELLGLALDELKKYNEDIDVFVKTVTEFLEDIGKQIGQVVISVNRQIEDIIHHNFETLKDAPIVATIQEKWQELKGIEVPEEVFGLLHEIVETLKQLLPTNEATQFVTSLESVLLKVLRHEEIKNRDEVMKQLYQEFVAAVKSLVALLAQSAPQTGLLKPAKMQSLPLINFLRIPSGNVKFSLWNLLTSKDFVPSLQELLSGLRISLNPANSIPPYHGHGLVIGGTELVTFDGLHLSIPAPCSYILAEDYKDRNFSIVAQIASGALKSITVVSGKHNAELRPSGNALVDGQETVLPKYVGALTVWRRPTSIGVWSDAGVLVICSNSLDLCYVDVNGFYFGRTRGLLGNMNGEQFDDRLLPEGKVVAETGDLANGWKLDGSCSVPSTAGHKHNRVSECTEIFSEDPLSILCRPFINPAPYRDACDHLAAKSKDEGACLAARAYTVACREQGVEIAEIPDACASCKINGKEVPAGESVSTAQGKTADIVLAVYQTKDNEENYKQVAIPLVNELKAQLASSGVSDVRTIVIGGSPITPYANFFTNKQGEIAFDPASNNIRFDPRPEIGNTTFSDRLKLAYRFIRNELGLTSNKRMYADIYNTPNVFRPDSFRIVIGVHGKECIPTPGNFATYVARLLDQESNSALYSVIAPIRSVEKDGKPIENAAFISENEVVLTTGEVVRGTDYEGVDICVMAAIEDGIAISPENIRTADIRKDLLNAAATKIVQRATEFNRVLDCECTLWKGVIAYPECSVSEA